MKKLNILKGIRWVVGKVGFMKKCGDTITAFFESLQDFETKSEIIWENEKNNKNNTSTDIAVSDVDSTGKK